MRKHETKKIIPLLLMKFCLSFVYTVLHATKDTIIVTSKGSGAETIPILKGGFVLFFAFLITILYSKLSNHLSKSGLFYATLIPFICFFGIYGFFLYPNRDWLCPHQTADWLTSVIGPKRVHWVAVYRYWMDSIFFLMAELWGGMVILLSFWGLANRIYSLNEASRFYTLFSAGGHIGVIIAGPLIWHFAHSMTHFELTIKALMGIAAGLGFLILGIYWWIDRNVVQSQTSKREPRTHLSLLDSLKHILSSPSLGYIVLMVIGYGLSVNMIEVIWKAALKLHYPEPKDYEAFMGLLTSLIGFSSLFLALFVGGNIIRRLGWYIGALSTPLVLGVASVLFLGVFFWNSNLTGTSLELLILIGMVHNIACKSMKYCLFDPTKEMAFIPLDEETKVKGKAAVDVVASRFGKSGSSWLQALFMELAGVGSVLSITPYLAPFVIITVIGWSFAVFHLKHRTILHFN